MEDNHEMLDFVKALAHADRLKIVGMLAHKPARLEEIMEGLSLPTRQVFNHLAFLEYVGVVHKKDELYELDTDGLERLARRQFEGKRPAYAPEPDLEKNQQKVLATFLNADGTIRQVPNSRTQAAKFRVVLEYILAAFEPGAVYTEKEVNGILRRFNEDVSGLRRDLIDVGMLARERDGSKYWRCPATEGNVEGRPE
jgi:ArsR family transcriptional regulator, arsenate/arsenite/antimonite-responsive transcriptional repressor